MRPLVIVPTYDERDEPALVGQLLGDPRPAHPRRGRRLAGRHRPASADEYAAANRAARSGAAPTGTARTSALVPRRDARRAPHRRHATSARWTRTFRTTPTDPAAARRSATQADLVIGSRYVPGGASRTGRCTGACSVRSPTGYIRAGSRASRSATARAASAAGGASALERLPLALDPRPTATPSSSSSLWEASRRGLRCARGADHASSSGGRARRSSRAA